MKKLFCMLIAFVFMNAHSVWSNEEMKVPVDLTCNDEQITSIKTWFNFANPQHTVEQQNKINERVYKYYIPSMMDR